MPHMHLLGHDMTLTVILPNGAQAKIVSVPDWDFNWQSTYVYKHPLRVPKGATIHLIAHYDNSARNPNNPPKFVTWGEKTTDEMCFSFLFFTIDGEHLAQERR